MINIVRARLTTRGIRRKQGFQTSQKNKGFWPCTWYFDKSCIFCYNFMLHICSNKGVMIIITKKTAYWRHSIYLTIWHWRYAYECFFSGWRWLVMACATQITIWRNRMFQFARKEKALHSPNSLKYMNLNIYTHTHTSMEKEFKLTTQLEFI